MLKLTVKYADLWNNGYMGKPETMAEPIAKIQAACRESRRDRATLGITTFIGLWFPDLQEKKPSFFDNPLTGTVEERSPRQFAAMHNSAYSTSCFSASLTPAKRAGG